MVLQVKRNENAPPRTFHPHNSIKSIGSRLRSSFHDHKRTHRARTAARGSAHASKQGKHKRTKTSHSATLDFEVATMPQTSMDVEMVDAEPQPRTTKTYRLPKDLLRPVLPEVSIRALVDVDPELTEDLPIEYIRDYMEELGPGLLRAAVTVVANPPKDALPKEIAITVNDHSDYPPPTHMLAIHGRTTPDAPGTARRQVTLVPLHSVVLSLYCARLPKLTPSPSPPTYLSDDRTQLVVPRAKVLPSFATHLAETYTAQALLRHINSVHGLWQNACVLGVLIDELWDMIDLAWEVLLTAMAISQGKAHLMLIRPSSTPPSDAASSSATPEPTSTASTPAP
ncbi:Clampless1 Clp1 protein [Favolaschia claudopus]|uniref:Clampless1 Clp1 protein n=1 Tax=Favolaschia claudopus TaxID=2862362 RepID=A0AAW0CQG8_9AGAR